MKDFRCFDRDPAFVIRSTRPCRNGRRAKSQVGHKQKKEKEKKSNTTSEAIQKNPLQNSISSRTKKNLGKKNSFFFLTLMFSFLEPEAKTLNFFLSKKGHRFTCSAGRKSFRNHCEDFFTCPLCCASVRSICQPLFLVFLLFLVQQMNRTSLSWLAPFPFSALRCMNRKYCWVNIQMSSRTIVR